MDKLTKILKATMTQPGWFGLYHWMWIAIVVFMCSIIWICREDLDSKKVHGIVMFIGFMLFILEIVKQYERGLDTDGSWNYDWKSFPLAFCSTPIYVMCATAFTKENKVRDVLYSFLATYSIVAGALVMFFAGSVYTDSIFINIHTMLWHGGMFIVGFLLLATHSVTMNVKTSLKATIVFLPVVCLGLLTNVIAHFAEVEINALALGPYIKTDLAVLDKVWDAVNCWPIFFIIYLFGFFACSLIVMLISSIGIKCQDVYRRRKHDQWFF